MLRGAAEPEASERGMVSTVPGADGFLRSAMERSLNASPASTPAPETADHLPPILARLLPGRAGSQPSSAFRPLVTGWPERLASAAPGAVRRAWETEIERGTPFVLVPVFMAAGALSTSRCPPSRRPWRWCS